MLSAVRFTIDRFCFRVNGAAAGFSAKIGPEGFAKWAVLTDVSVALGGSARSSAPPQRRAFSSSF